MLAGPVIPHAGVGGFGMIFCNRVMQSFGGSIRIASASGAGTAATPELPHLKNRMHRSYQ
ncbi:chemotaxis protein CheA [Paraburkholderia ginsengiterrae]|uniref:Chemotaxis protein CheA n=1 Tax=Paraburkholderia ginsengiterrae TaxID=1462993 RepID=A0ABX2UQC9_9BURK|nr:chemotaxis protein CheA [Paraburkholderia ginsengiterrae]